MTYAFMQADAFLAEESEDDEGLGEGKEEVDGEGEEDADLEEEEE